MFFIFLKSFLLLSMILFYLLTIVESFNKKKLNNFFIKIKKLIRIKETNYT